MSDQAAEILDSPDQRLIMPYSSSRSVYQRQGVVGLLSLRKDCIKLSQSGVASRVRRIAKDSRYKTRADDLESLADTLDDDQDDTWTGINLFAAFPSASTVVLTHRNQVEQILGVLAGISVFMPVAWTWWSLHEATAAYDALLSGQNGAEDGRTFLALWIRGFDGHLDHTWHRLVPMALISLSLIGFAVLMIVLHRVAAHGNVTSEEVSRVKAEADLVAALSSAQRELDQRRFDDPTHIDALVKRSVERLRAAHSDTQASTTELRKATKSLGNTLSPLVTEATTAAREVRTAVEAARRAQSDLGSSLSRVQSELDQSLQALGTTVGGHTQKLGTAIGTHTQDLRDGTTQALAALSGGVAKAVTTQQALGNELRAFTDANTTAREDMRDLITQTRDVITQVRDAVNRLDSTLHGHDGAIQAQASELTAARDAAERLLSQLELIADPAARPTAGN